MLAFSGGRAIIVQAEGIRLLENVVITSSAARLCYAAALCGRR